MDRTTAAVESLTLAEARVAAATAHVRAAKKIENERKRAYVKASGEALERLMGAFLRGENVEVPSEENLATMPPEILDAGAALLDASTRRAHAEIEAFNAGAAAIRAARHVTEAKAPPVAATVGVDVAKAPEGESRAAAFYRGNLGRGYPDGARSR